MSGSETIQPSGTLKEQLAQIERAMATDREDEGVALARAALNSGHVHPSLYGVMAFQARKENDRPAALQWLMRARELDGRNTEILYTLGSIMLEMDELDGAIVAFDQAIALNPTHVTAIYERGTAWEKRGNLVRAIRDYDTAAAMQPRHAPSLSRQAYLAAVTGKAARARQIAERVLAIDPDNPVARIAQALADLSEKNYQSAKQRLDGLIGDTSLSPVHRAICLNMLGDAQDGLGHSAQAFSDYEACNEILREQHQKDALFGNGETALARAQRIAQFLSAQPTAQIAQPKSDSGGTTHVFLLGFPRSGTTLLEVALRNHSQIATSEENDFLTDSIKAFLDPPDGLERLAQISDDDAKFWRDAYWTRVKNFGLQKAQPVFVDKLPLNTISLPLIARLFPDAKILFALRDPRNVVFSCFRRRFAMNPSMYQLLALEGTTQFYATAMQIAQLVQEKFNPRWQEIRYEKVIGDFQGEIASVCAGLGLEWESALDDIARTARERPINTPSTTQLTAGIDKAQSSDWRRYRDQLAPVLPILAPWVERFGYPQD